MINSSMLHSGCITATGAYLTYSGLRNLWSDKPNKSRLIETTKVVAGLAILAYQLNASYNIASLSGGLIPDSSNDTRAVWKAIAEQLKLPYPTYIAAGANVDAAFSNWVTQHKSQLDTLQKLNLSFLNLTSLPEAVGNLINLEELRLYNNKLTSLPESFGNLINLEWLDLKGNKLTYLPESFGNLINLEWLDLDENKLISPPESLRKLINLKLLYLNNNKIKSLPESVRKLKNLKIKT